MTHSEVAVYINGQVALLNAEIAMMKAGNDVAIQNGTSLPYGDNEFYERIKTYDETLSLKNIKNLSNHAE